MSAQTLLGFDWGKLRVGVASANTVTCTAQSVTTLTAQGEALQNAIVTLVQQWRPSALVAGVPYHPDGQPHRNTAHAKRFAQQLRAWTGLQVFEVDERYSTVQAKADNPIHSAKQAKSQERKIDALSACILLEQYFQEHHVRSTP